MPSSLLNAVNCNIAVWMITPFFGLENTGYWGMAMFLAYTPIGLIADSIYQVLLQNVSTKVSTKQPLGNMFVDYAKRCASVVIPFFALLYVITPWLVRVLLGDGWEDTAQMIRYFLPWLVLYFFSLPWDFLPNLFEKQSTYLIIEFILLLSRLLAIGVGWYVNNLTVVVVAYSMVSALVVLVQLIWYGRLVENYNQRCQ